MAAALECWSGRPSTDEDMVEQVLIHNPDRSEIFPNSNSNSNSNPSSPSHYYAPNPNSKKWQQRISRNLAGAIASLKNSLNIDSSSTSPSSSSSHRLDKLFWGAVVRNLTQLYPGSQLPEKLVSDIRAHFDSLPSSYANTNFDMKQVLLHLRLVDQAATQDQPAFHVQHLLTNHITMRKSFRLTFAYTYSSSVSWTSISSSALDPDTVSCDCIQIFDRKGLALALGVATLSVLAGHEKQFRARIDSAFRSAAKKPPTARSNGVKLPFGLCGCQEDGPNCGGCPEDGLDHDLDLEDRIVQLSSPLPRTAILVSVDEWQTVVSGREEASRWILCPDELELCRGCYRGRRVWIKKLRGCERGTAYEIEMRQDLLQLMSCGQRTILRFVGICIDDSDGLCIVTRMMNGGSVHDLVRKGKRMGVKEVTRIALDVAEGLMFMNAHGVAYRDLNARRILLDKQGNACLGDMGVVSSCRNAGEVTEYETAGYRWLAPEIIAGDPESVTETWMSNVYSFGMVVWEMVTGQAAYSSYSPVQAAVGITACGLRPEIPKDCPQVLRSLMMKCWNNCPSKRPTFSEITSILQKQNNR